LDDLTQILTANLAAKYQAPLPVALGSILALSSVAALAVTGGQWLLRRVNMITIRKVTAAPLLVRSTWAGF
jgi:putative Ca2+/H+ antiporter (TMEM165/GDT1 family)